MYFAWTTVTSELLSCIVSARTKTIWRRRRPRLRAGTRRPGRRGARVLFLPIVSWIGRDQLIKATDEKWARVDDRTMAVRRTGRSNKEIESRVAAALRHKFRNEFARSFKFRLTRLRVERRLAMTMARREDNFYVSRDNSKCHVKHFASGFETFSK